MPPFYERCIGESPLVRMAEGPSNRMGWPSPWKPGAVRIGHLPCRHGGIVDGTAGLPWALVFS